MKKAVFFVVFVFLAVNAFNVFAQEIDTGSGIKALTPAGSGKYAALTFDDGPTGITIKILDELAKYNAKATFFVLGDRVEQHSETMLRIVAEGHQLGNHSYNHAQLVKLPKADMEQQIDKANDAIFAVTGVMPTILRTPYGQLNKAVLNAANERGMAVVHWSLDTHDWAPGTPASRINTRLLEVSEGDIVLLHDLFQPTFDALTAALKELTERGFSFVTFDELVLRYSGGVTPGVLYESGINSYAETQDIIDFYKRRE